MDNFFANAYNFLLQFVFLLDTTMVYIDLNSGISLSLLNILEIAFMGEISMSLIRLIIASFRHKEGSED